MIIVMRHDATPAQVSAVVSQVEAHGCRTHLSDGDERTVIGVIGTNPFALRDLFIEAVWIRALVLAAGLLPVPETLVPPQAASNKAASAPPVRPTETRIDLMSAS